MDKEFIKERIKRRILEGDMSEDLILKDTLLDLGGHDPQTAKRLVREVKENLKMDE